MKEKKARTKNYIASSPQTHTYSRIEKYKANVITVRDTFPTSLGMVLVPCVSKLERARELIFFFRCTLVDTSWSLFIDQFHCLFIANHRTKPKGILLAVDFNIIRMYKISPLIVFQITRFFCKGCKYDVRGLFQFCELFCLINR